MNVLDTDTLTLVFKNHPLVTRRLEEVPPSEGPVGTTVFNRIEILRGRFDFLIKAANGAEVLRAYDLLLQTEAFLTRMVIVPFDARAAEIFDRLCRTKGLKKSGGGIS